MFHAADIAIIYGLFSQLVLGGLTDYGYGSFDYLET